MKAHIFIAAALIAAALPAQGQNVAPGSADMDGTAAVPMGRTESMLREIERNNTTLEALRQTADAEKIGNRTGILLSDPEIGFSYLWGGPASIGNRQDVSVSQAFDFGTVSGLKRKVADSRNSLVEWEYMAERMKILLDAKLCCIGLVHSNALIGTLETRRDNADATVRSQSSRLEHGEGNIVEYNSALLNLTAAENELTRARAEHEVLLSQLASLNGGIRSDFSETVYDVTCFPESFELWYAEAEGKNPVLAYVRAEIELSRKELSLSRTENLPSLSVGYMGEFTLGQRYQGISFGISVPLWSNARKVRRAKASVQAAESREKDARQQFYSRLETQYIRAAALKDVAQKSRAALERADNRDLLEKALELGQISVSEYIVSVELYYDALKQTLDAEKEYQEALAELYSYEL